ncbi:MAG: ABC transporter substrate-binding protein [Chryseobacterium sp.]|nr:ABC transporter substrate-binding protein [Chryseobacterium sp.]OJX31063.1 MAG: hemin ABC transporter substrate-binding protein [Chryseobacterium sp. 36-9]
MKNIKIAILSTLLLTGFSCKKEDTKVAKSEETKTPISSQRIVSISGGVTEIVVALGHEKEIVGIDVTSTYPESLEKTAENLGHVRSMTVEPIMKLSPTLILASNKDINPDLLEKIKSSGIQTELFNQEFSINGTKKLIDQLAKALGNTNQQALLDKIDTDVKQIRPIVKKPKVLFIYARGNMMMVAGKNTPMASIIEIAGGQNAANDFEDFKPLTPEAVIQSNPDVLLFFTIGLQGSGGAEGALKMPGVSQTNAGKNKKVIALDGGLLSSFGPRVGEAALSLNRLLIESSK